MISALQAELERRADPDKKAWWENYVKGTRWRGVPMAEVRAAVNGYLTGVPANHRKRLAHELIREPLCDDKLAGILILSEHLIGELGIEDLREFRGLFEGGHLSDWSSCDWFCVKVLGRMLERSSDRARIADELVEWTRSDDLWVRRAGLVGFVNLAPKGEEALPGLTERVITGAERNSHDERRFAQTSVGWTLRELSASAPEAVRRFLAEHGDRLSAEARRAASAKL